MKTLFISDMDGTLLLPNEEIDPQDCKTLNALAENGMCFTVASARTLASASVILQGVRMGAPMALMNGVLFYDTSLQQCVHVESFPAQGKEAVMEVIERYNLEGFLYALEGNEQLTFYVHATQPQAAKFMESRKRRYKKKFVQTSSFRQEMGRNVIYYSIVMPDEELLEAYSAFSQIPCLNTLMYKDVYNPGFSYMEVCSAKASKYHAVQNLRERYGFDWVVGFGDNTNDLPMFQACDESYAVANALPEVKAAATGVIGENTQHGVCEFLVKRLRG